MYESKKSIEKESNPITYSHDMKEHSPHIVTVSFVRVMGMRMVVQIRTLPRAVELVVVVIMTKSIIRCYGRRDRIFFWTPSTNSIQYGIV